MLHCKSGQLSCIPNTANLFCENLTSTIPKWFNALELSFAISAIVTILVILINTSRILLKAIFTPFVTSALLKVGLILKLTHLSKFSLMLIAPRIVLNVQTVHFCMTLICRPAKADRRKQHQIVVGHDPSGH